MDCAAPHRRPRPLRRGVVRRPVPSALGIHLINNQVDIGVRVELPAKVFEHITDVVYESKLIYRTKRYGDRCAPSA